MKYFDIVVNIIIIIVYANTSIFVTQYI